MLFEASIDHYFMAVMICVCLLNISIENLNKLILIADSSKQTKCYTIKLLVIFDSSRCIQNRTEKGLCFTHCILYKKKSIDFMICFCKLLFYKLFAGLQIVFNLDEVSFIQNLVFYIESAYCIPVSILCRFDLIQFHSLSCR